MGDLVIAVVWAEFDLDSDSLSTFSSSMLVCLRCIGPSHPLWEKLPLRISIGVGALANTFPVASHIPDGGLDSRNLSEALRRRPVTPDELLEPVVSRLVGCLVSVVGDSLAPSLVAMIENFRAVALD